VPEKFDADRAASILIDVEMLGSQRTCAQWGVSRTTIMRYRDRLAIDPDLLQRVTDKKRALNVQPAPPSEPHVTDVLHECEAFIARSAREADPKNPEMLHAIVGAYKTICDARRNDLALEEYLNALRAQTTAGSGFAHGAAAGANASASTAQA
jgi:hypothetical protein